MRCTERKGLAKGYSSVARRLLGCLACLCFIFLALNVLLFTCLLDNFGAQQMYRIKPQEKE